MNYRANCLKLADYLDKAPTYRHSGYGWCGSPGCAWGWACHSEMFGLEWISMFTPAFPGKNIFDSMKELFGKHAHEEIFSTQNAHIKTAKDAANALRVYADKHYPADNLPPIEAKKSGSDIAREIMSRPYNDKEMANA